MIDEKRQDLELGSFKGIHHMAVDSINLCEVDIKRELYSNIILTGGNAVLDGVGTQFSNRLSDIV